MSKKSSKKQKNKTLRSREKIVRGTVSTDTIPAMKGERPERKEAISRAHDATDKSRNERQKAMLLTVAAELRYEAAVKKIGVRSAGLIAKSKELCDKSEKLKKRKTGTY